MKVIALLLVCLAVANSSFTEEEYQDAFVNWMHEHGKIYTSEEFEARYEAFKWNMDYVEEWNANNNETILGLNVFADLTLEEFKSIYLGLDVDASDKLAEVEYEPSDPTADTVDWRTHGAVTGVKNQGQCGSCWSFSTTGSVEGANYIKNKRLTSLSEQNLMDCSTSYGNHGCNGGLMDNAFRYIVNNHGIDTEASYPYEARAGTCRYKATSIGATITSYKDVTAGSEVALQAAVQKQPVSVAIDASHPSFQLYKSGVYYERQCSATRLDHGVLAVGYGTDSTSGQDYWIVKNSWGTSWGTAGYILMTRNKNNNCGIATMSSIPIA